MGWVLVVCIVLLLVPRLRETVMGPLSRLIADNYEFVKKQIVSPLLVIVTFIGAFYALMGAWAVFLAPQASWHWLMNRLDYPSALVGGVVGFCSAWSLREQQADAIQNDASRSADRTGA